jgi:hypothetical protein
LRLGHLTPYFDQTNPTVAELVIRTQDGHSFGQPFTVCGAVTLSAIAQDSTSMPVPGDWAGLPVSPAVVSWRLQRRGGHTIVPERVVANFLEPLPPNSTFWDVYARGTFQNSARFGRTQLSRLEGRFVFVLSPNWDTRRLRNGEYDVTVTAEDARGNDGTLSQTITVANGSPSCPV